MRHCKSSRAFIRVVINDPEVGMQMFIDMNPADGTGAYHHAVFNPSGPGDVAAFETLTGYDLQIDRYLDFVWIL